MFFMSFNGAGSFGRAGMAGNISLSRDFESSNCFIWSRACGLAENGMVISGFNRIISMEDIRL